MTAAAPAAGPTRPKQPVGAIVRQRVREQPLVPLLILLIALVVLLLLIQPTLNLPSWASTAVKFATPLAILAACQTLTMLTGGIDLSVAGVATMSAYVMVTQTTGLGGPMAVAVGLGAAIVVGVINGVGVGVFRVNPLIMTIGMGLVVTGGMTVYQTATIASTPIVPPFVAWIGGGSSFGLPNSLLLFIPLAGLILFALGRFGYGRLLYAVGDNHVAARLAGARVWQVLLVVYVISAFLAGVAGIIYAGITNIATLGLVDPYLLQSVAAVVIGGTSIFGGRGGYAGSILGALILTVLVSLLTTMQVPNAVRTILFGAIILGVAAIYARSTSDG